MRYKRRRGKETIKSTKKEYDGIKFDSLLEIYCYKRLKEEGISFSYNKEVFSLLDSFKFHNNCLERRGKSPIDNRGGKNIIGMKYTPDFTNEYFIIEVKGTSNETFPIRWKLFKHYLNKNQDKRTVYKPQSKGDIDFCIHHILKNFY